MEAALTRAETRLQQSSDAAAHRNVSLRSPKAPEVRLICGRGQTPPQLSCKSLKFIAGVTVATRIFHLLDEYSDKQTPARPRATGRSLGPKGTFGLAPEWAGLNQRLGFPSTTISILIRPRLGFGSWSDGVSLL